MKTIDVAIIGSGAAGVAACVAAKKSGLSVLLIDKNKQFGGRATYAEVGTICGLYHAGNTENPKFIAEGFPKIFAERIFEKSALPLKSNSKGHLFLPYHIADFHLVCASFLQEYQIEFLEGELKQVAIQEDAINCLTIEKEGEELLIAPKIVIDCSGNAIVSQLANTPLIHDEQTQSASLVVGLKNVQHSSEMNLQLALIHQLKKGVLTGAIAPSLIQFHVIPGSVEKGSAALKWSIPFKVEPLHAKNPELKVQLQSTLLEIITYLQSSNEQFKSIEIAHLADQIGWRIAPRGIGKMILTEEMVLNCEKTNTAVANCSWPIEFWHLENGLQMQYLHENDYYQIPVACLESKYLSNLLFAGSTISADEKAIASARVMGICLQTGYASGLLAYGKLNALNPIETLKQLSIL